MKKIIKYAAMFFWVVTVLSGGMIYLASNAGAQDSEVNFAQMIQGSWVLVSIYNEQDGKKIDVFGPNPRGLMINTPEGRWSTMLMRASLPKFSVNSRMKGTAEENQAVVQGSIAYFGTYTVTSDKEPTLNLHVEGSTFPNFDGQDQKRFITFIGDEMKLTNPTPALGGGTNYVIWKRAKSVSSQESPPTSKQAKVIEVMVNKAAALVETKGKAAFSEFRKQDSEWWSGNTYLFVYDKDMNVLLNPAFPKREGTNVHGQKDANGKLFHDEFMKVIKSKGSGWVDYMFPRPGQTQLSHKWGYVKAVNIDGTPGVIGAGFYTD